MGTLRTIYALAVVFAHLPAADGFVFVGGRNAVQLFYIISGFLISYVLTERGGYATPSAFYLSRWLRLYPMYFVVACLTLVAYCYTGNAFFDIYKQLPLSADIALIAGNALLLGQDWLMFTGVDNGDLVFTSDFSGSEQEVWRGLLVPQAWTLGVEVSFYILAPFVLLRKRLIVVLLVLSLALRAFFIYLGFGGHDPWTYRFFPTELALFLSGSLAHQVLLPFYRRTFGDRLTAVSTLAVSFLVALSLAYFAIPVGNAIKSVVLFACFILLVPLSFVFQNKHSLDRKIGELSYPIYISHMFVIFVVKRLFGDLDIGSNVVIAAISITLSVMAAAVLNRLIGDRIERVRGRLKAMETTGIRASAFDQSAVACAGQAGSVG